MPSGTGATKSGCKVTTYLPNCQTFSRFFLHFEAKDIQKTGNRLVFATETDLLCQPKMAEGIQDTVVINRGCRIVGLCF